MYQSTLKLGNQSDEWYWFYYKTDVKQAGTSIDIIYLAYVVSLFTFQGSTHLQKIGRFDFSFREHEGEVKAWQVVFQQLHRDMFPQNCRFFASF